MTASLFLPPRFVTVNESGTPRAGAKLYFYEVGTTTAKTVYSDSALTTQRTQPVVADSAGSFGPIYVDGECKASLYSSNDVLLWTEDNIPASNAGDWPITAAEVAAGLSESDLDTNYRECNVLRYGADPTGSASSVAAFTTAINVLPATGGTITVPRGTYRIDSAVTITTNRVWFDMDDGATLNISSSDYGFHWSGTSGAAPGAYGGIRGGRLLASGTATSAAVYISNFIYLRFERMLVQDFYTAAGGGSRAGFKAAYTYGTQFVANDVRWCDHGYDIAQDSSGSYRSTTISWQGGNVSRCAKGVLLSDVFGFEMDSEFILQNDSLGLHCTGAKTTGTNCANGDVRSYFEANGKHVLIESTGSARSIGIGFNAALFEGAATTYAGSSTAMEDFGTGSAGDYKLEISGDRTMIEGCYWSSAASTADILINDDAVGTYIGYQQRANGAVSDSGSGTIYAVNTSIGTLTTADGTPSVSGLSQCNITNAAPQTITALDDGYAGQVVRIRAQDGNTTFQHAASGPGLRMWGGANFTLVAGQVIEFVNYDASGIWVQTGLTNPTAYAYTTSNVSADRSFDANSTTLDEVADVLGTLIADLKLRGLLQ